ncbi:MAG: hypothetical protein ABEI77_08365 [Halorientalis sp.]
MSGKSVVGHHDDLVGRDTTAEPTLAELVEDELDGAVPETIVYRENSGTLAEPADEWHRVSATTDLPEKPLDGWDELYVYTDAFVYRWVGVGFGAGPDKLPRSPDALEATER